MLRPVNKPLFVELTDYSLLVAQVSDLSRDIVIESLIEFPLNQSPEQLTESVIQISGVKRGQLSQSVCSVYPDRSMVRRATLDNPAKAKDPAYLPEFVKQQFKVDVESFAITVLNASLGTEFKIEKAVSKELIFCGAPKKHLQAKQDQLLSYNVYPERLELGTLATVGGLINYTASHKMKAPTLMLEIGEGQAQVLIFQGDSLDVARPIPYGLSSMYPIVQKELGLKDEESARKLFSSNTFDFTEMGPILLKRLLKELQASTGFYEVQTGQTIGQIFLNALPDNLSWIGSTLSRTLGVDIIKPDYVDWLAHLGIGVADSVDVSKLGPRWFGLFALMGNFNPSADGGSNAKGK